MKVLVFTNQKGGTGKTTSALSVAAGLTRKGYKVLIIDLDPQGSVTTAAGYIMDENTPSVYEVLKSKIKASEAIRHNIDRGYDLLPADIRLSGADLELADVKGRDFLLHNALAEVKENYDYAVIDSPPSLGILSLMGLTAADGAVIVLKADYLALAGVAQLVDTIDLVRQRLNPGLELTGVLITFYDGRKTLDKTIAAHAEEGFPGKVFKTKITQAVALAEAPAMGQDIFLYRPNSKSSAQYEELTNEILERI